MSSILLFISSGCIQHPEQQVGGYQAVREEAGGRQREDGATLLAGGTASVLY
jgi:hypothetical protein